MSKCNIFLSWHYLIKVWRRLWTKSRGMTIDGNRLWQFCSFQYKVINPDMQTMFTATVPIRYVAQTRLKHLGTKNPPLINRSCIYAHWMCRRWSIGEANCPLIFLHVTYNIIGPKISRPFFSFRGNFDLEDILLRLWHIFEAFNSTGRSCYFCKALH